MNTADIQLEKQRALAMLQSGRNDEAKALCTTLCQHEKTDPESWFLMAAVTAQLGLFDETADACRKVIELNPSHFGARYNLGVALQFSGKLHEAAAAYRELISLNPSHADACNNLGQIYRDLGLPEEAVKWFNKSNEIVPDRKDIQANLGLTYTSVGKLDAAEATFRQMLAPDPDNIVSLSNLGLVMHMQSRHSEAAQYLVRALDINPEYAEAHNTLANVLLATGKYREAVEHFLHAARLAPDNASFHYNLGVAYQRLHNQKEAEQAYRNALKINPEYLEAWNNLGQCLLSQENSVQAIDCFSQALHMQPASAAIHNNLATAYWRMSMREEALAHALEAVLHDPGKRMYRQNFAQIASMSDEPLHDSRFEQELVNTLSVRGIDHQLLVTTSLSMLARKNPFSELLDLADRKQFEVIASKFRTRSLSGIFHNRLFQEILFKTVIVDVRFEQFLMILRRLFLDIITHAEMEQASMPMDNDLDFMCALACQCFNTEYINPTDRAEQQGLDKLLAFVESGLEQKDIAQGRFLTNLVIASMYIPMYRLRHHKSLLALDRSMLPKAVQRLIRQQLIDPSTDLALCKEIQAVTSIEDETSKVVREQYESLPYPRWLDVSLHEPRPLADVFCDMYHHFMPIESLSKSPRILIAGCGSGRHAIITATRFADAEVLAIDLSKGSLAYATRMADELGVKNIKFAQGDILKLDSIDDRFDVIESVGVLHHLADPLKGLMILLELLRPSGLINIGLYSRLARRSIISAQRFVREKGYSSSKDDMRKAREEILALDHSHPIYNSLTSINDFYSLSEFCDLVFHAQESCYTLPGLAGIIEQCKLKFIGFELSDPLIKQRYKKLYPQDKKLTNLANWDALEQHFPDTFIEMYTFWSQKA